MEMEIKQITNLSIVKKHLKIMIENLLTSVDDDKIDDTLDDILNYFSGTISNMAMKTFESADNNVNLPSKETIEHFQKIEKFLDSLN